MKPWFVVDTYLPTMLINQKWQIKCLSIMFPGIYQVYTNSDHFHNHQLLLWLVIQLNLWSKARLIFYLFFLLHLNDRYNKAHNKTFAAVANIPGMCICVTPSNHSEDWEGDVSYKLITLCRFFHIHNNLYQPQTFYMLFFTWFYMLCLKNEGFIRKFGKTIFHFIIF